MSKLIPLSDMPATRLELRWRPIEKDDDGYTWFCDYDLVLEINELDIRGEVYDDDGGLIRREREKRLSLGGTKTTGSHQRFVRDGEIETPFRDGAHIQWDAKRLGLPMFVVFDGQAMKIEPRESK